MGGEVGGRLLAVTTGYSTVSSSSNCVSQPEVINIKIITLFHKYTHRIAEIKSGGKHVRPYANGELLSKTQRQLEPPKEYRD
jgi:hypothetical protein